jgi:hypothetical protein
MTAAIERHAYGCYGWHYHNGVKEWRTLQRMAEQRQRDKTVMTVKAAVSGGWERVEDHWEWSSAGCGCIGPLVRAARGGA